VLSEKERNKKTLTPPPFKLNGRSLIYFLDKYMNWTSSFELYFGSCRGCDRMVVWFTATYAISVNLTLWARIPLRRDVLDTTLCDKVCQCLATGQWFSPGTQVSSTSKTDRHDITEILLKVALNTITLTLTLELYYLYN
jgi:hypothetical protein